ncbi:MAG: hypothetical protein ACOCQR_02560 [bacterium]
MRYLKPENVFSASTEAPMTQAGLVLIKTKDNKFYVRKDRESDLLGKFISKEDVVGFLADERKTLILDMNGYIVNKNFEIELFDRYKPIYAKNSCL